MRLVIATFLTCLLASPVAACDTALLLAVDVSASVSAKDYELQVNGIADGLLDPDVTRALVSGEDALAMLQWSGNGYQVLALPWQSPKTDGDVAGLAETIRRAPRPGGTDTALGRAVKVSIEQFVDAPDCDRRVIDVSGDGVDNDGNGLPAARAEASGLGIVVNGLAIEIGGIMGPLTDYYRKYLITADGFVVTAQGRADFPRAIRAKLLRELTRPIS